MVDTDLNGMAILSIIKQIEGGVSGPSGSKYYWHHVFFL